ncbi:MAG TPA: TlpA disulfide reductase family protein [Pseudorhodoplanes sp.]|jgi:thiol-disulfide isomerase/thioredoxin|nr:TlpA disulfide reductase family protein [Steroidobacteraceae bacterium]HVX98931.1 TlpA disulfide reductase family protein [Pseudorhodoplanes sp.]
MNGKVIAGVLVVAVAMAGGFALQRSLGHRPTITQQDRASAAASAAVAESAKDEIKAPANQAAPQPRAIPETLPAISLPDRDGVTRTLSDWKGQPVVVNFWATWCGPCREEIPLLKALRNERSRDRLEIIGIAIDQRDAVLKYAREIGIDYPILIGEKEGFAAAESLGVALVLPFSVFADSSGHIVTVKIGELHPNEAEFILDRVRDVDMKRLDLASARRQIADKLREFSIERGKQAAAAG